MIEDSAPFATISTSPAQAITGVPAPGSRQAEVLHAVNSRGSIRVSDLAQELAVTPITIRRDVLALAELGLLRKVHGGAKALGALTDSPVPAGAQTLTIGVLVPSLDYYWPDVIHGAAELAQRRAFKLALRESVYHAADETDDLDRLVAQNIAGLLIAPNISGPAGVSLRTWIKSSPVPIVLMERELALDNTHQQVESVISDHSGGAATAVFHLAGLGHQKIGVILNQNSPHTQQLHAGWLTGCRELDLPTSNVVDLSLPERTDENFTARIDQAIEQIRATKTTALVIHSDPEAVRLMQRAEEVGLRVPQDFSIISYDDQVASLSQPALSALRTGRKAIGRTALETLAARIQDPSRPVHRIWISPELISRQSSGPPPLS